jgi:pyrroline-5-carboxylate reductase
MTLPVPVVVVGGGRMGEAIVSGLLSAGAVSAADVVIAEPREERRRELGDAHGVRTVAGASDALTGAMLVLLAVKPQVVDEVARGISSTLSEDAPDAVVVSIAAGVSCARLESALGAGVPIVRVMPNTPALVHEAMSVVSGGTDAAEGDVAVVVELFDALGETVVVDERYQDVSTALSGSGPAYVAIFVDALARAGVRHGLPRDVAQSLAVQTLVGTASLLDRTGQHPEELVDAVSSPGGTTIAAVEALEDGGFRSAVADAVNAAVERAKELGS